MKSILIIECQDNTKRRIEVLGQYSYDVAVRLARDIEGVNYKSVTISK